MASHFHNTLSAIPSKTERLNHAAKTVQKYKDGGMNAAQRTVNWFISADHHKTVLN